MQHFVSVCKSWLKGVASGYVDYMSLTTCHDFEVKHLLVLKEHLGCMSAKYCLTICSLKNIIKNKFLNFGSEWSFG